jgi:Uma2 family endonuclease
MSKKPILTEQRIVLPNITWQKFEQLVGELGSDRTSRMTYLRGRLELMTPIAVHERCSRLFESMIQVLVDELDLSVEAIAPILMKYEELDCATETDAGYYFQDWQPEAESRTIHLPYDPPPNLVVEVALTKSSIDKLPIYAALGIPEVWRYLTKPGEEEVLKGELHIYQLDNDRYEETRESGIFAELTGDRILEFVQQSDSMSLVKAIDLLRAWVRALE